MVWSQMMMRFWNSTSVAVHATLRRMYQNDDAAMVLHVYFISGCCFILSLPAAFARAYFKRPSGRPPSKGQSLQRPTKTRGVKVVLLLASFCDFLNGAMAALLSFSRPQQSHGTAQLCSQVTVELNSECPTGRWLGVQRFLW